MPLNSRSLKQPAWRAMRDAVPSAVLVTLLFILLTDGLGGLIGLFVEPLTLEEILYGQGLGAWSALFLDVVLMLLTTVLTFGYWGWALRTARGEEAGFGTLMDGFGMVGTVIWMEVQIFLRTAAWGLALMVIYVSVCMPAVFLDGFGVVLVLIFSVIFYFSVVLITLRYSLSYFLLYDYPEMGASAAVRRSVGMMRGHYGQMIRLYLSFWKWYLADILLGIVAAALMAAPVMGQLGPIIASGDIPTAVSQLQLVMNSGLGAVITVALAVPLHLFFAPYLRISLANFYRVLSQEPVIGQREEATF